MLARWHLIIRGRVQGIGYRWFVREKAAELELTGWVSNRPDGTVEAEAEGDTEALALLSERLKTGHPYARVESIEATTLKAQGGDGLFDIR